MPVTWEAHQSWGKCEAQVGAQREGPRAGEGQGSVADHVGLPAWLRLGVAVLSTSRMGSCQYTELPPLWEADPGHSPSHPRFHNGLVQPLRAMCSLPS